MSRNLHAAVEADAELAAGGAKARSARVVPERRDQGDGNAEARQVLRDVPRYPAGAGPDVSGIRIPHDQRLTWKAVDIDIGCANGDGADVLVVHTLFLPGCPSFRKRGTPSLPSPGVPKNGMLNERMVRLSTPRIDDTLFRRKR